MQDEIFEQVDGDKLVTSEGFKLVKDFLENELAEEELYKMVRVWEEFDECPRGSDSMMFFSLNLSVATMQLWPAPKLREYQRKYWHLWCRKDLVIDW